MNKFGWSLAANYWPRIIGHDLLAAACRDRTEGGAG